ncbi:L,D-transpeptidase [Saccharothrix sp. ST-888]|uniref:L,D-transpeptidase n=1 Tax=Saccharothrix sp. ST-888 TaxID=1427391 RepID=UPI000A52B32C|nr:Ig-like domain-containing protein [Saccharothrix sp. ST-888]
MKRATGLLAVGGVLVLAGCSGGGTSGADHSDAVASPKVSTARLAIEPKDGSQGAAPNALKVSVASGKLTSVAVTDKSGKPVDGTISADGASWSPSAGLAVGAAYQVSARAADADGVVTTANSAFTTLTPEQTLKVSDNVDTGEKYGVGMIVSVRFGDQVKNRAEAQKAITVEATDGTVVKGHWFEDGTRLDLRPENYWKPDTTVKVHFRTKNVELSPGVYGDTDRDEQFTIGRSKVSAVDASSHMMVVKEDGRSDQNVPITAGANDNPSWNGTMVISAKSRMEHMASSTVSDIKGPGYSVDEPHALRLTNSGTYVHGNPKAGAVAGRENISHGCIGLPDSAQGDDGSTAGRFYADSLIGDVVTVKNSVKTQALNPDNGLSGWNMAWSKW